MVHPHLSDAKKLEELSAEELEQFLNSDTLPETQYTDPVLEFVQRFDLQPGKNPIPTRLLYKLFLKYYPRILSINEFSIRLNKILPYKAMLFYLNKENVLLLSELKKPRKKLRNLDTNSVSAEFLNRHFGAFFESVGLTQGNSRINWWILYELYTRDCKSRNYRRNRSTQVFINYMSFHFKSIPSETGPIFLINSSVAGLINKGEYAEIEEKYCHPKEDTKRKLSTPRSRKRRKPKI